MAHRKLRIKRTIRKIFKPTVGKLLGILTAAYFIFTFISISGRADVNYYEVEDGSLVKEHDYTGLILRQEEIIDAESGGYIYFYVADGRKTAAGEPVYLIDAGGDLSSYLSSHSEDLTDVNSSKLKDIRTEMLHYSRSFSDRDFNMLYDVYDSLEAKAVEYSSLSIFNTISDDLKANGISFQEFPAGKNGTVCYYTDGYESVTENELSAELFDKSDYKRNTVKAGDLVEAGSPAYKLITDENWYIAFMLNEDDAASFSDSTVLTISFPDKGFKVKVPFRIVYGSDGGQYGLLTMNSYLVQFTSDRFVSFDIVSNDVSGLKIPDKAITTKDFYIIPSVYLTEDAGGNTGFNKAIVGDNGTSYQFVITDIYSKDDDYCYIECDENSLLKPGDYVVPPLGTDLSSLNESTADPSADNASDAANAGKTDSAATDEENEVKETSNAVTEDSTERSVENTSSEDTVMQSDSVDSSASAESAETERYDPEALDEDAALNRHVRSADSSDEDSEDIAGSQAQESSKDNEDLDNSNDEAQAEESDNTETNAESETTAVEDDLKQDTVSESPEKPVSSDIAIKGGMYCISAKMPLKGVYNINKGYTVFRKVDILESSNGYSIVKKNSVYGLSTYDHIVLDASVIGDGQLIYR